MFGAEREAWVLSIPAAERASRSPAVLVAEYGAPLMERWRTLVDGLRAEARTLIEEKWPCVEAVAEELYRKKSLDGDRVCEIIEGAEDRIRDLGCGDELPGASIKRRSNNPEAFAR